MTLIFSAVCGDYAVQVSDRRLTLGNGVLSDGTNKAVLFCSRAAFAYTGLAKMGNVPMDEWLTQALVTARTESLSDAVNSLAQQATREFQKLSYSRKIKSHAFACIGWTRLRNETFVSPIICSVSNALDENDNWLQEAKEEFSVKYTVGPAQSSYNVVSYGQTLLTKDLIQLRRKIRRCFERKTGPEPVAKCLQKEIHRIARFNSKVGHSLMVVSLPKSSAFSMPQVLLTDMAPAAPMTLKDSPSFYHVAHAGAAKIRFAPNTACAGQGFRNVKLERLNGSGSDVSIEGTVVLPK